MAEQTSRLRAFLRSQGGPIATAGVILLGLAAADAIAWPLALILVAAYVAASLAFFRLLDQHPREARRSPYPTTSARADKGDGQVARSRYAAAPPSAPDSSKLAGLTDRVRGERMILDALPAPVIVINSSRRVVHANAAARASIGAEPEGRDLAMSLRIPEVLEAANTVLEGADGVELEYSPAGEDDRLYACRVARLPAESAGGVAAVITLFDLTPARRAEQMRVDFVANVSHELRTPLASLMGFIETLQGPARDDPEAQSHFLIIMREQASRMVAIVNDLLSLSRIELDEHVPPRGSLVVEDLLRGVANALEPQARAREMTIVIRSQLSDARVVGDANQLTQVFTNLIDNAIKYGREGSEVAVTIGPGEPQGEASDRPASVGTAISDQGEGIPREHLPRLTERFYRVDTARSRALGGTGLGLAIVKHVINRHQGTLKIESEPGRGSTFTVVLPAARVMEPSAAAR